MLETEPPGPQPRWRRRMVDLLALIVALGLLAVLTGVFLVPWASQPGAAGEAADRYLPQRPGASLSVELDDEGEPTAWTGESVRRATPLQALREWHGPAAAGLRAVVDPDSTRAEADVLRRAGELDLTATSVTRLQADGARTMRSSYHFRSKDGVFWLGLHDMAGGADQFLDPPALLLPAEPDVGATWSRSGRFAGAADYRLDGEVVAAEAHTAGDRAHADCLRVQTRFTVTPDGGDPSVQVFREWLCSGQGSVESIELDADGTEVSRTLLVADRDGVLDPTRLPPVLAARAGNADAGAGGGWGDAATWGWSRVGRLGATGQPVAAPTATPLWVPTEPPLLVVPSSRGELVAFDAQELGVVRWRVGFEGSVVRPPAWDPATRTLVFGTSAKRVHAVDERGLLRWSATTQDAVVASPVVVGDVAVVGVEDGRVHGLDVRTGARRWTTSTGDAVVAGPTAAGSLVAVGSDDGAVHVLDASTGKRRWRHDTGAPVQRPVAFADDVLYVTDRGAGVTALAVEDGGVVWTADLRRRAGAAPVVVGDLLVVTDDDLGVHALDLGDGDVRWSQSDVGCDGSVAATPEGPLCSNPAGQLLRLDSRDGRVATVLDLPSRMAPEEGRAFVQLGLGVGGGAVWPATVGGLVSRVTARPLQDAEDLALAFTQERPATSLDDGYSGSPVAWRDKLLLADGSGGLDVRDPQTGASDFREGVLPGGPAVVPVVAGDALLAVVGGTLHALGLPDGRALWRAEGDPVVLQPPVVTGDVVLWVSGRASADGSAYDATLRAVSLQDGRLRWEAPAGSVFAPGGVLVQDDSVHVSDGSTFDLATGVRRGDPLVAQGRSVPAAGGPGSAIVLPWVDVPAGEGVVTAVDADSGAERWSVRLGEGDAVDEDEAPLVSGALVVLPLVSGQVVALSIADGSERWRWSPTAPRFGRLLLDDGALWSALEDGRVEVRGAQDGALRARSTHLGWPLARYDRGQQPVRAGAEVVVALGRGLAAFTVPGAQP